MPEVTDPRLLEILNKPAGQRAAPQPVLSLPNTGKAQERANDQVRTDIAVEGNDRARANERLGNAQTLRKEFDALPEVKSYKVASQQLAQALNTGDGAQGDLALTYAFAKAMDPDSVVREAEQGMVAGSQPWLDAAAENVKKQFGMDGAGNYTPEARAAIRQQIIRAVAARNKQYVQRRADFSELANRNQIDPFEVVGKHMGSVYLDQFRAYDKQRREAGANVGMVGGEAPDDNPFEGLPTKQAPMPEQVGDAPEGLIGSVSYDPSEWDAQGNYIGPKGSELGTTTEEMKRAAEYVSFLQNKIKQQGYVTDGEQAAMDLFAQGRLFGLGDEIRGVISGAGAALQGEDPAKAYQLERDLTRMRLEQDRNNLGGWGTLAELAGGAATGRPFRGVPGGAVGEGAAMGALAGFGYGNGAQESLTGAGIGAVAGGALGAAGQKAADALAARQAARAQAPLTQGGEVIDAAQRLNQRFGTEIAPLPADVAGAGIGNATGASGKMPLGAHFIGRARDKISAEAENARNAIAAMVGDAAPTRDMAGDVAIQGTKKYLETSKTKVDALYAKARRLGGDQPVDLANARAVLDEHIAELAQTPGGAPGLEALKALRSELDQPFPVEGVKRMRTTLRDRFMGDGMRATDIERRVGQVVDAADDDVLQSLQSAGKQDAADAYRQAATAHRERVQVIDEVLAPIVGKNADKSVEDVMTAIESASKTKGARLGKLLSVLPKEDAQTVRATLIQRLGNVPKGSQNEVGDKFSLEQFLTHWNDMSATAKGQLFGGETRAALDDLAKVASARKESGRFTNFSNTGSPIGWAAAGGSVVAGLSNPAAWGLLALDGITGRALASPAFARWLAKYPSGKPALIAKHAEGLSKIAANDTVIAADALGLQRQLTAAFAGPQRLAAEPQGQGGQSGAENTRTGPENR